ncbi:hypothetical protein PF008_g15882 [Phytophthora fragariae]|uniref:Uncharacterized protein n=1 Tax=Phytophthora fragariae TaxID=53985 RepID=A0A6G0RCR7_9STRA|nr:hypothetical protein PF008_g15882 [Phytophthora fragariae]
MEQPTSDSQYDAIVEWLEEDDNFHCAELIENNALNKLAATVNATSPRAKWDGNTPNRCYIITGMNTC